MIACSFNCNLPLLIHFLTPTLIGFSHHGGISKSARIIPTIGCPLASMPDIFCKQGIVSSQQFYNFRSAPTSSSSVISDELLQQDYHNTEKVLSAPSLYSEFLDDPITGTAKESSLSEVVMPMKNYIITSTNKNDKSLSTATPSCGEAENSLPKPKLPVVSMPFSSEGSIRNSCVSSPVDSRKDLHSSSSPSVIGAGFISQCGIPSQSNPMTLPQSKDNQNTEISKVSSLCKGMSIYQIQ